MQYVDSAKQKKAERSVFVSEIKSAPVETRYWH